MDGCIFKGPETIFDTCGISCDIAAYFPDFTEGVPDAGYVFARQEVLMLEIVAGTTQTDRSVEAERELNQAIKVGNIGNIKVTLESAKDKGVEAAKIKESKRTSDKLIQAGAASALDRAIVGGSIEKLMDALESARHASVEGAKINDGELRLKQLQAEHLSHSSQNGQLVVVRNLIVGKADVNEVGHLSQFHLRRDTSQSCMRSLSGRLMSTKQTAKAHSIDKGSTKWSQ